MPSGIERERIFSDDSDPLEELRELRAKEAEESAEEEESSTDTSLADENEGEKENTSEEPEDLEAFEQDEEEKPSGESPADDDTEESEETPSELYKFKANGQDFEFTQEEINSQFGTVFGKAMDYTQKMQKISPYRKMISALEEENISQEQLNLAIDVLKGDKGALQKLITDNKIDVYDLDTEEEENSYQAKDYGKNEHELALEEIDNQISADPEYSQTVEIIGKQWDERSRQALSDNPQWIAGLHSDVKSGVFAKVSPEATKMKMLDGGTKPDIEYYLEAGERLFKQQEDPAKEATQQFKDDSAVANKKRAASSTRARPGSKGVVDYLEDNDEKFDAWYDKLMQNS